MPTKPKIFATACVMAEGLPTRFALTHRSSYAMACVMAEGLPTHSAKQEIFATACVMAEGLPTNHRYFKPASHSKGLA